MANEVGRAQFTIFGEDGPFQRKIRSIFRQRVPPKEVEIDADTQRAQDRIQRLMRYIQDVRQNANIDVDLKVDKIQAAQRYIRQLSREMMALNPEVHFDADTGTFTQKVEQAERKVDAFIGRRHHLVVTADMSAFERASARARIAMQAASEATHSFNQNVRTMHNVGRYFGRAALMSLLGALGPLTSGLLVAGGAIANVTAGIGLLAAAALPSIAALTKHEVAEERLETTMKSRDDAMKGLADAEENYGRAVDDGARRVQEATRTYRESRGELARAQRDAARSIAASHRSVADAERSLADAQKAAEEGVADAIDRHREAREDLNDAYADARERVVQAIEDARDAERRYREEVAETARANREAMRDIAEAEQNLRQTQIDARQDVIDAYADYREAVEQARETVEDNARKIADARRREQEAIEDVEDAEFDLRQGREDVYRATQDLIQAQQDLNEAMREEPRRQAEAQIDLESARLDQAETTREIAKTQQELAEARMMGDTERVADLELRLERLRLRQWQGAIDLQEAEENLNGVREEGSEELNSAREAAEAAWRQQQEAQQRLLELQEQLKEAQAQVGQAAKDTAEAQREAAEATEDAQRRIVEAQLRIREAQRNGARDVREAARQVIQAEQNMIRTRREGARSVEEARRRMIEAERGIIEAQVEGAEQIRDAQKQAQQAYEGIIEARIEGTRRMQEAGRGLSDALREQGYAIEDANYRVAQAQKQMTERGRELQFAQTEAADDISEANEQVAEAIEGVAYALEEMEEAAEKAGATLTSSQQALWDQIQTFVEAYKRAFGPAGDVLNYLGVEALQLAQQTLPFLGNIALETATRVRDEFRRMVETITEPRQLSMLQDLLSDIPKQTELAFSAAWNFALGFLNILDLIEPHTRSFWQWIKDAGQRFREWTQSVSGQSQIREFFERTLPVMWRLLQGLGHVVAGFFKLSTSPAALQFFDYVAGILKTIGRALPWLQYGLWLLNRLYEIIFFIPRVINRVIERFTGYENALGVFAAAVIGTLTMMVLIGGGMLVGLSAAIIKVALRWGYFGRRAKAGTQAATKALHRFETGTRSRMRRIGRMLTWPFRAFFDFAGRALVSLQDFILRWSIRLHNAGGAIGRFLQTTRQGLGFLLRRIVLPMLGALGTSIVRFFNSIFGGNGRIARLLGNFGGRLLPLLLRRLLYAFVGPAGWIALFVELFTSALVEVLARWDWFKEQMFRIADWLSGKGWFQKVLNFWRNLPGWLQGGFIQALRNTPILGALYDLMLQWQERFLKVWGIDSPSKFMEYVGWALVAGMHNGIVKNAQMIFDVLYELAKQAWNAVTKVFKFGSPSKRMEWAGKMIAEGFAKGIRGGQRMVLSAINEMTGAVERGGTVSLAAPDLAASGAMGSRSGDRNAVSQRDGAIPELTIPIYLGGKRVDEYIVNVITGEIRAARRKGMGRGGVFR